MYAPQDLTRKQDLWDYLLDFVHRNYMLCQICNSEMGMSMCGTTMYLCLYIYRACTPLGVHHFCTLSQKSSIVVKSSRVVLIKALGIISGLFLSLINVINIKSIYLYYSHKWG